MKIEDYLPNYIVYNSYLNTYYMLFPNDPYNIETEHILQLSIISHKDRTIVKYTIKEGFLDNDKIIYDGNDSNITMIKSCVENFNCEIGNINNFIQDKFMKRNLTLLDLDIC